MPTGVVSYPEDCCVFQAAATFQVARLETFEPAGCIAMPPDASGPQ
jgi:hypothetical protein